MYGCQQHFDLPTRPCGSSKKLDVFVVVPRLIAPLPTAVGQHARVASSRVIAFASAVMFFVVCSSCFGQTSAATANLDGDWLISRLDDRESRDHSNSSLVSQFFVTRPSPFEDVAAATGANSLPDELSLTTGTNLNSSSPGGHQTSAAAESLVLEELLHTSGPVTSQQFESWPQLESQPHTATVYHSTSFSQLFEDPSVYAGSQAKWQLLPDGLLYPTYLAGYKEPRIQWNNVYDTKSRQRITDATLGGRVGIIRNGTRGAANAQGFQLDLEGAVFARILPDAVSTMLVGSDYRVGLFGTWRRGNLAFKSGYYHISAHVGDEFLEANPTFNRINYVRDSLLFGLVYDVRSDVRLYGEIGVAPGTQGGAKMFELQFGTEYSPVARRASTGAPYVAMNAHLREDFNFSGSFNALAGWGWQGPNSGRRLRVGFQYYSGPSIQYEFFDQYENLLGAGVWFDY